MSPIEILGSQLWDDQDTHVEELLALVADHAVARAAFAEAVRRRPGKIVILRQKSRILADSRGWGCRSYGESDNRFGLHRRRGEGRVMTAITDERPPPKVDFVIVTNSTHILILPKTSEAGAFAKRELAYVAQWGGIYGVKRQFTDDIVRFLFYEHGFAVAVDGRLYARSMPDTRLRH